MSEFKGLFLRLGTIFKYLHATPDSRCVSEGEEVLAANELIMCGISDIEDNKYNITALCMQTSALLDHPHEIKGSFSISGLQVNVDHFTCSCKAGLSGTCKHVSACLFYCTRNDLQKLEKLSTTDVQCYWTKSKSIAEENFKPEPTKQWSCLKHDAKRCKFSSGGEQQHCLKELRECQPRSILNKHMSRTCGGSSSSAENSSCSTVNAPSNIIISEELKRILQNADSSTFTNTVEVDVQKNLTMCCKKILHVLAKSNREEATLVMQGSGEWKELRRLRITGSTCYSIYTYSKADWEKKSHSIFFPKFFKSIYTAHGIKYEKEALCKYKQSLDCRVVEVGFVICKLFPWLGYSPDGVVIRDGHPIKLIEIKCPYSGIEEDAATFATSCKYIEANSENYKLKKNINITDKFS